MGVLGGESDPSLDQVFLDSWPNSRIPVLTREAAPRSGSNATSPAPSVLTGLLGRDTSVLS